MSTPREKSPLLEKFSPEDQTHHAASSRTSEPNTQPTRYFSPIKASDSNPLHILGQLKILPKQEKYSFQSSVT